jgi:hypothetical protein
MRAIGGKESRTHGPAGLEPAWVSKQEVTSPISPRIFIRRRGHHTECAILTFSTGIQSFFLGAMVEHGTLSVLLLHHPRLFGPGQDLHLDLSLGRRSNRALQLPNFYEGNWDQGNACASQTCVMPSLGLSASTPAPLEVTSISSPRIFMAAIGVQGLFLPAALLLSYSGLSARAGLAPATRWFD